MAIADRDGKLAVNASACAYCLCRFTEGDADGITICPTCTTPYHPDCFEENGGCATFGCPAWVASQVEAGVAGAVPPSSSRPQPQVQTGVWREAGEPQATRPISSDSPTVLRSSFCSMCGSGLELDYVFCAGCGSRIVE